MPSPSLEEFRSECLAFLDATTHLRSRDEGPFVWGQGQDALDLDDADAANEFESVDAARAWRSKRWEAGLGYITGATEHGGRELSPAHDRLYNSLEGKYEVPDQSYLQISLGMVAPTVADHAQDHIARRYLPGLHRGELIGCQLFSEPGAGSDLAGLQSSAERDGEEWVVNGQKVWTSGAHYSDVGELICRTDPDAPKHRGMTAFLVDMRAPGVEVRPLRQMNGGSSFNEVFFTDVRIPDDHRLGEVNDGWSVALTTLMNERASLGSGSNGGTRVGNIERLREMVRHFGLESDPLLRAELVDLHVRYEVARLTNQRATDRIKAGQLPGPEHSIAKLALTDNLTRTGSFVGRVIGPRLVANTGEWGTYSWSRLICGSPGMRIAGGTDEVLRNIIGERVLGLPKDPAIDASIPFRDLAKN